MHWMHQLHLKYILGTRLDTPQIHTGHNTDTHRIHTGPGANRTPEETKLAVGALGVSVVYLGFIQGIDTLDAPKIHLRYTTGYTLDTPHIHLRYTPDTPGPRGQWRGQWPPALCSI